MEAREEFLEFIEKLGKESRNKIVVVEGIKDKKALERLGVKNIITLKAPLYKVVEGIVESGKGCIILTDLDKKGKELYAKLYSMLAQFGVKVDNSFRIFLFKTKLRQIEGITRYYSTIMLA